MSLKDQVFDILENEKNENYISGENIALQLSVSRAAIWKSINSLKQAGYNIESVTNKGYRLLKNTDVMTLQGINQCLENNNCNINLMYFDSVSSTNTVAKQEAEKGCPDKTVIVSNMQTNGRGRFDRKFYSPSGCGVYVSFIVRPFMFAKDATLITTAAAVAVCEAIEDICDKKASIKWVNDVLINNKKVSGILTEASLDIESGNVEYVIVGIGVNIYEPENGFDPEIQEKASSVLNHKVYNYRNVFVAKLINKFFFYYNDLDKKTFFSEYKRRCIVPGKKINVIAPSGTKEALALELDNDCRLVVKYNDGKTEALSSGEVSIRF